MRKDIFGALSVPDPRLAQAASGDELYPGVSTGETEPGGPKLSIFRWPFFALLTLSAFGASLGFASNVYASQGRDVCDGLTVTIEGTRDGETINGTPGDDVIHGGGGDDIIRGRGGNDRICGGNGNDTITANSGNDRIFGQAGDDTIRTNAGNDYIAAGQGNDRVLGGDGRDEIVLGVGNDWTNGGSGNDTLRGGDGRDILVAGAGHDYIAGGEGNDRIDGGHGPDVLIGGNGNDKLVGGPQDDQLKGGAGNDVLDGGVGTDTLIGGADGDLCTGEMLSDCENPPPNAGYYYCSTGRYYHFDGANTYWQIDQPDRVKTCPDWYGLRFGKFKNTDPGPGDHRCETSRNYRVFSDDTYQQIDQRDNPKDCPEWPTLRFTGLLPVESSGGGGSGALAELRIIEGKIIRIHDEQVAGNGDSSSELDGLAEIDNELADFNPDDSSDKDDVDLADGLNDGKQALGEMAEALSDHGPGSPQFTSAAGRYGTAAEKVVGALNSGGRANNSSTGSGGEGEGDGGGTGPGSGDHHPD